MFYGEVPAPTPAPALARYLELHPYKDTMIPDLLVHQFPSDQNRNGAVSVELIYDTKTICIDKHKENNHTLSTSTSPRVTTTKVHSVCCSYLTAAEKLGIACTGNDGTAPFSTAIQTQYHSDGVHP